MIKSMTAFASAEGQYEFGRLSWELRSVNHRFLEHGLRLPEEFRVLEPEIRQRVSRHVKRGKVDATLRFTEAPGAARGQLVLNQELATGLKQMHAELSGLVEQEERLSPGALLRWPGVVEEQMPDPEPMRQAALRLLDEAVQDLNAGREREGEQLDAVIRERLDGVTEWVGKIREWLPDIRDALRKRMSDKVSELAQGLDPARLEQEVAVLAQKMDVDEELDRLDAHVVEARHTLGRGEPVGRRMDFLMQEFNRESNTLSSKSVDQRTTQAAVELKVLIEQMREQVQNVE